MIAKNALVIEEIDRKERRKSKMSDNLLIVKELCDTLMKYFQFAMIIIIVVNAISVLPKRHDEKNMPDYFWVNSSSSAGVFFASFFPIGIVSLALSLISVLCYTAAWMKKWTNKDVRNGVPKGKTVLSAIMFAVMGIILSTVTFCIRG